MNQRKHASNDINNERTRDINPPQSNRSSILPTSSSPSTSSSTAMPTSTHLHRSTHSIRKLHKHTHLNNSTHSRHRNSIYIYVYNFLHRINYICRSCRCTISGASHDTHRKAKLYVKEVFILLLFTAISLFIGYNIRNYIIVQSLQHFLLKSYGFHPEWHPSIRSERFPSVEERIKLYMSNWYLPPCPSSTTDKHGLVFFQVANDTAINLYLDDDKSRESNGQNKQDQEAFSIDSIISLDPTYVATIQTSIDRDIPVTLTMSGINSCPPRYKTYCDDGKKLLNLVARIVAEKSDEQDERLLDTKATRSMPNIRSPHHVQIPLELSSSMPPILLQIGDDERTKLQYQPIPILKKFRYAATQDNLEKVTSQDSADCHSRSHLLTQHSSTDMISKPIYSPIIWLLNYRRHYGFVKWVPYYDIPWEAKTNKAIWRGAITGYATGYGRKASHRNDTDLEKCQQVPRCNFILNHRNSQLVDAAGSKKGGEFPVTHIDGQPLYQGTLSMSSLLQNKAIVILEGNDVSSGLKWVLYSRSVVLMPPPTKTSFAMEELLEEWVHYIPLHPNLTNVEEQMQWVLNHDEEAQRIAERATLFIHDLMFHPDAEPENDEIQTEIMKRYLAFFRYKP